MKRMKTAVCLLALFTGLIAAGCAEQKDDEILNLPEIPVEKPSEFPIEPPAEELPEEPETPEAPEKPTLPPEQPEPEDPAQTVAKAQYLRVTGDSVNLRSGAGTGYSILGKAEKNTLFAVTGETDGWYQTYCRGRKAFISKKYAVKYETTAADKKTENVIDEGMKLLGVPYVYGAVRLHDGAGNFLKSFTKEKFDCSSLMQYIFYYGKGALLSVTSRTQASNGKAVDYADLQRGDLLFFTNASRYYKTGIERIGHVALYLGDGYILHTASDFAKVERMSETRRNYFICARRV